MITTTKPNPSGKPGELHPLPNQAGADVYFKDTTTDPLGPVAGLSPSGKSNVRFRLSSRCRITHTRRLPRTATDNFTVTSRCVPAVSSSEAPNRRPGAPFPSSYTATYPPPTWIDAWSMMTDRPEPAWLRTTKPKPVA